MDYAFVLQSLHSVLMLKGKKMLFSINLSHFDCKRRERNCMFVDYQVHMR